MELMNTVDAPTSTEVAVAGKKTVEVTPGQVGIFVSGLAFVAGGIGYTVGYLRGKSKGAEQAGKVASEEVSTLKKAFNDLTDRVTGKKKEKPIEGEVTKKEPGEGGTAE